MKQVLQFSSGICNVSPDMAGKLGGASFLLSGAEPPPSGSQAPVSASSPVLTGANSISLVLHHLHDVTVDAARFDFAHDSACCHRDGTERQHCNYNDLNIKHDCFSVIRWNVENTE